MGRTTTTVYCLITKNDENEKEEGRFWRNGSLKNAEVAEMRKKKKKKGVFKGRRAAGLLTCQK